MKNLKSYVFSKVVNVHTKTLHLFVLLVLSVLLMRCSKEFTQLELSKKNLLSTDAADFLKRIEVIKNNFYDNKMEVKLTGGKNAELTWYPDWDHPSVQMVNDSISYLFFRLHPKISIKGKIVEAKEGGRASYLIVKNEKEYYKGMYYKQEPNTKQVVEPTELSVENFSGKLLLVSLVTDKAFVVEYKNGFLSNSYLKKVELSKNKIMSNDLKTASVQTNCHMEDFGCTFYTYTPNCGGTFWVILVDDCQWPNWCQNAVWILGDVQTREVCDNSPFPDPPVDPTNPYDPSNPNNPGNQPFTVGDFNSATTISDRMPKVDITKYTNCFSDGKIAQSYNLTIYVDQPVANTNEQFLVTLPTYETDTQSGDRGILLKTDRGNLDVGHTFVSFEKINPDGTTVKHIYGFYPDPDGFGAISKGAIKLDGGHGYEMSYTITVTDSQFFAAIAAMTDDYNSAVYNVLSYNCTDAALRWMNAAGAGLTSVNRGLFNNTPGDFGQELRTKPNTDTAGGYANGGGGPCN